MIVWVYALVVFVVFLVLDMYCIAVVVMTKTIDEMFYIQAGILFSLLADCYRSLILEVVTIVVSAKIPGYEPVFYGVGIGVAFVNRVINKRRTQHKHLDSVESKALRNDRVGTFV